MTPRLYAPLPLEVGSNVDLPPAVARHAQVLRVQPGESLILFDGRGGEYEARVLRMGRSDVEVRVERHVAVDRELDVAVTLALGMPANDRMDTVVEKATELGVAVIQPLLCERSVLRLTGDRADKKVAHWRAVAVAASEQCGRTRVPAIEPVRLIGDWLRGTEIASLRFVLSLQAGATPLGPAEPGGEAAVLSGPEGGLSPAEEALAGNAGFRRASLGPRVLRADTAPLAALTVMGWRALNGISR